MAMLVVIFALGAGVCGVFVGYVVLAALPLGANTVDGINIVPLGIACATTGLAFGFCFCSMAKSMADVKAKPSPLALVAFAGLGCYCFFAPMLVSWVAKHRMLDPVLPWSGLGQILASVGYFMLADAIVCFALWRGTGAAVSRQTFVSCSIFSLAVGVAVGAWEITWGDLVMWQTPLWGIAVGCIVAFHLPVGAVREPVESGNRYMQL